MDKYSYSILFSFIVLFVGSCSQLSSPAEQTSPSALPSSQEMGCSFVDSSQSLGAGRSWDVSLGDQDDDGDLDDFIVHDQLSLSEGGGMPNEVWWNETH